jgi:hypothetical protein
MALPSGFILKKYQVLLTQRQNSASGMITDGTPFLYGYIEQVNDLCDLYVVGEYVLFDASTAIRFTYDDVFYYLTTEDNLFLIEPYIAP